jgi:hypothetical protein
MKDFKKFVTESICEDELFQYLTAPWGYTFGLYRDGSVAVGQDVGREIAEDDRPLVTVDVPGINELDMSDYADGYAEKTDEGWEVNGTGEVIDDEELIRRACADGDVSMDLEDLRNRLMDENE